MYNWVTLLYSRNQYNFANQLYFNKINLKKKNLAWQKEWVVNTHDIIFGQK